MSDATLECCGQTFVGPDRWRHVFEIHVQRPHIIARADAYEASRDTGQGRGCPLGREKGENEGD